MSWKECLDEHIDDVLELVERGEAKLTLGNVALRVAAEEVLRRCGEEAEWRGVYKYILRHWKRRARNNSGGPAGRSGGVGVVRFVTPATVLYWVLYNRHGPGAAAQTYELLEPMVLSCVLDGDCERARLMFMPVSDDLVERQIGVLVEVAGAGLLCDEREAVEEILCSVSNFLSGAGARTCRRVMDDVCGG